jgi:hypothetical protein
LAEVLREIIDIAEATEGMLGNNGADLETMECGDWKLDNAIELRLAVLVLVDTKIYLLVYSSLLFFRLWHINSYYFKNLVAVISPLI